MSSCPVSSRKLTLESDSAHPKFPSQEVCNVIDSDTAQNNHPKHYEPSKLWIQIGFTLLTEADKDLLVSEHGWLNDKHIHAAMQLLKLKYPECNGLEDPILCSAGHVTFGSEKPFVQVLNDSNSHWICISNKDCKKGDVNVYCSLHKIPSEEAVHVLSTLICLSEKNLRLKIMNVSRQIGPHCGIFAIANAFSIVSGMDPCNLVYDQSVMRTHLASCLLNAELTPFPVVCYRTVRKQILREQSYDLWCKCRKTYMPSCMVECTKCAEYYHTQCIGMSESSFESHDKDRSKVFICEKCQ